MPNKLTDAEVKKALECCIKSSHFGECFENECPLVSEKGCKVGKEQTLYPYALDLINRYEEKNSNLSSDLSSLQNDLTSAKAEVERLSREYFTYKIRWAKATARIETAKAEAYKECIEKAKPIIREIVDLMFDDNKSNCVIHDCVKPSKIACNSELCIRENKQAWENRLDNLLNELVGDLDE